MNETDQKSWKEILFDGRDVDDVEWDELRRNTGVLENVEPEKVEELIEEEHLYHNPYLETPVPNVFLKFIKQSRDYSEAEVFFHLVFQDIEAEDPVITVSNVGMKGDDLPKDLISKFVNTFAGWDDFHIRCSEEESHSDTCWASFES